MNRILMKRIYEVVALTILFLLICFIYKGQQRLSYNGGLGWDGVYYYPIAEQLYQGTDPVSGQAPFIQRPGTPLLIAAYARISGSDILDSAVVVNLAGMYLTTLLLFLWLGAFINKFWLKGLLSFLFMMAWYLPLRVTFQDPMATDAWGAAWFMAGLLFLPPIRKMFERKKDVALFGYVLAFSLVVGIGVLFRESNAVLFLALFFIVNPLKEFKGVSLKNFTFSALGKSLKSLWKLYFVRQTLLLFIPLIFIVLAKELLSNHILIEKSDYSYIKTLFKWFYTKSLPEYLLGIFNACGPLVVLLPFFTKEIRGILREKQELLFLLMMAFVFGWVGGSDTERIFFMSAFPVLLIWMGYSIKRILESSKRWWFYILCVLQTISFRFFWNLPDHPSNDWQTPFPFFGFFGDRFQYLFLYAHHGQYILNSILFAEYVALFLVTWYLLSGKSDVELENSDV
ncbi:MAG TPA: hypothetical protein VIK20_03635 [Bacteroidales bacterium]